MQFTIVGLLLFVAGLKYSIQNNIQIGQTNCDCGEENPSFKIIGGNETSINQYPWMAAVIYKYPEGYRQICGGSLITHRHILTAAHCFDEPFTEISKVVISLGDHDLSNSQESHSKYVLVDTIIIHPNYNITPFANDIAILVLKRPIAYRYNIRPICMPPAGFDAVGKIATVAGWGATRECGRGVSKLREVSVTVYSHDECYLFDLFVYNLTKNMICAGNMNGGEDACQGDSGGPLFYNCGTKNIQIGIVANGYGCARRYFPGIYMKVTSYLDFIRQNIKPETLCPTSCAS